MGLTSDHLSLNPSGSPSNLLTSVSKLCTEVAMSLNEVTPIFEEFTTNPVAFMGGFVAGMLRLNLAEDPVKSWLTKKGVSCGSGATNDRSQTSSTTGGPQSITID